MYVYEGNRITVYLMSWWHVMTPGEHLSSLWTRLPLPQAGKFISHILANVWRRWPARLVFINTLTNSSPVWRISLSNSPLPPPPLSLQQIVVCFNRLKARQHFSFGLLVSLELLCDNVARPPFLLPLFYNSSQSKPESSLSFRAWGSAVAHTLLHGR